MKIFAGPRGSGRTTALLKWARQDATRRDIVVHSKDRREWMNHRFKAGIIIHTYEEMSTVSVPSDVEFGIDDFELFLGRPFPLYWRIEAITLESSDYINIRRPVAIDQICADLREIEEDLR